MAADPVLEVKDLTLGFGAQAAAKPVVRNVSFALTAGETLGIVGESGSGKSLTALSVVQLTHFLPDVHLLSGEVHFFSKDGSHLELTSMPESQLADVRGSEIGMIFQDPMSVLNPVFRCGPQVGEVLRRHQGVSKTEARVRVLEWFQKVELGDVERMYRAYPHELSGGQKQRIMIAMAMACGPRLLIADEPTTALDVTTQQSILSLMAELQAATQSAMLFISHDLGVVAEVADRVLVMQNGEVVESGNVKEVFSNPQHPYTRGLLACRPPLEERYYRLPVLEEFLGQGEVTQPEVIADSVLKDRLRKLTSNPPVLEVHDLEVTFMTRGRGWFGKKKPVRAVDQVSFSVFPGEILGLVGESGCGKTTLGRALCQLTPIAQGQIWLEGQPFHKKVPDRWKQIQLVFQDPFASLNPRKPIGEAILEPMRVHRLLDTEKARREKAVALLESVELEADHFFRLPHAFSGGQRQRICIARALAVEPRFLILDESVSSLDVPIQAQVLNLLLDLRDQFGFSAIFISHDLSVVRFMSDRILVMKDGKIVEEGPAEEIFQHPSHPYTQQLVKAIPGI